MRVAIVGPSHPLRGGIAQHNAVVARALIQRGHEARIFGFLRLYPRLLFPGTTELDESDAPIDAPSEQTLVGSRPHTWLRTAWRLRRWEPDVVVLSHWHPFFVPLLSTIRRVMRGRARIVVDSHNVVPHEPFIGTMRLVGGLLRTAETIVVHSAAEAERAGRIAPSVEVREVPLLAPFERCDRRAAERSLREEVDLPTDAVLALFFGLVRPYKGLADAVHAIASTPENVHLLVAGESYEPAGRYESLVEELNLEERVHLRLAFVPNEELASVFEAADIVVLPYRSATQSGVLTLARMFGLPALVTRVGGLPELVEDGVDGYVCAPRNPAEIAERLATFAGLSPEDRDKMAVAAGRRNDPAGAAARTVAAIIGEPTP